MQQVDQHVPQLELAGIFPYRSDSGGGGGGTPQSRRTSQAERLNHSLAFNSSGTVLALANEGDSVKIYDPVQCRNISSLCEVVRAKRTGCSHVQFPGATTSLDSDILLLSSRHVVDNHVYTVSLERGEYVDAFAATSAPCSSWSNHHSLGGGGSSEGGSSGGGHSSLLPRQVGSSRSEYISRDLAGDQDYFTQLFGLPTTNLFGACAGGTINLWSPSRRESILKVVGNTTNRPAASGQQSFGKVAFSQQSGRSHYFVATTEDSLVGMDLRNCGGGGELWSLAVDKLFPPATLKAAANWCQRLDTVTATNAGLEYIHANEGGGSATSSGTATPVPTLEGPQTLREAKTKSRVRLNHFGGLSISPTDDHRILLTHSVTSDVVLVTIKDDIYSSSAPSLTSPAREPKFSVILLTKDKSAEHLGKYAGGVSTNFGLLPHPFYTADSGPADLGPSSPAEGTLGTTTAERGGGRGGATAGRGGAGTTGRTTSRSADTSRGGGASIPQGVRRPLFDQHLLNTANESDTNYGHHKNVMNYLESDWRFCGGSDKLAGGTAGGRGGSVGGGGASGSLSKWAANSNSGSGPLPPGKSYHDSNYSFSGWQTPRLTLCCPAVFLSQGNFIVQGTYKQRVLVYDARKTTCPAVFATPPVSLFEGARESSSSANNNQVGQRRAPTSSADANKGVGAIPTIQANPMFAQVATADTKLLLWSTASDWQKGKLDADRFLL